MKNRFIFVPQLNKNVMSQTEGRITDLLNQTDLNWNVNPVEIFTATGNKIKGYSAMVREDNGLPLSIMSESYYPYQNSELLELLDKVSKQTGLPIHKGGYFGSGEKVYLQLKSNDLKLGNDRIEGYVTGVNSFDGSTSLAFGPSNITISCMNTFYAAFRNMDTKVRHTKNMVSRVDEICRSLEGLLVEEKEMFNQIVRMSETRFDDKVKELVTKMLFNVDRQADLNDVKAISKTTQNKLTRFYVDLNGELQDKGGDNMWALFSGVTKYTTHSMTNDPQRNMKNKMFSSYGDREKKIFNELVELTN